MAHTRRCGCGFAEFDYAKEPVETLNAFMLQRLYWHGMLRGRA